jgi:hypothetical protein
MHRGKEYDNEKTNDDDRKNAVMIKKNSFKVNKFSIFLDTF